MSQDSAKKAERIATLSEADLRQQLLVPLLRKLGYWDVVDNHGTRERGKDLVFKRRDRELGGMRCLAAVVKRGDISGSASRSDGLPTIINQVEQVFNEPFTSAYDGKRTRIDECLVITSGRIAPGAIESISGKLAHSHLDKLTQFIDGNRLIELVDTHFPEYWGRTERKSRRSFRGQVERLLKRVYGIPGIALVPSGYKDCSYEFVEVPDPKGEDGKAPVLYEIEETYGRTVKPLTSRWWQEFASVLAERPVKYAMLISQRPVEFRLQRVRKSQRRVGLETVLSDLVGFDRISVVVVDLSGLRTFVWEKPGW